MLNVDAGLDWLLPYREQYALSLPIMYQLDEDVYRRYRLGREYRTLPPLYIVIDKHGVVRHRSWSQGSISLEAVHALIEQLLAEP